MSTIGALGSCSAEPGILEPGAWRRSVVRTGLRWTQPLANVQD